MAYLVERMEKCLRAWEDFWFLVGVMNTVCSSIGKLPLCRNEGAVVHASNLRKKLLKSRQEPMNVSHFLPPKDWELSQHALPSLPIFLSSWCLHSRRVYYATEELQAVLNATSLEGVMWGDFVFPFSSYAVNLQRPLIAKDGNRFDFIMVNAQPFLADDGKVIPSVEFAFFNQESDRYEPLTEANRQNIRKRLQNREWEHLSKICTRFLAKINDGFVSMFFRGGTDLDVTLTAQKVYDNYCGSMEDKYLSAEIWDPMIRIIVGMCLYLKTLPSGSPHQSEWRPVPRSGLPDSRAISNEAQVCTVSSCYKLTIEERVLLGLQGTNQERAQYELSCHFRQGHWRRAPGLGHDPTATKTVHVRPCIVRKDRLREGELPGGSKAVV